MVSGRCKMNYRSYSQSESCKKGKLWQRGQASPESLWLSLLTCPPPPPSPPKIPKPLPRSATLPPSPLWSPCHFVSPLSPLISTGPLLHSVLSPIPSTNPLPTSVLLSPPPTLCTSSPFLHRAHDTCVFSPPPSPEPLFSFGSCSLHNTLSHPPFKVSATMWSLPTILIQMPCQYLCLPLPVTKESVGSDSSCMGTRNS